MKIPVYLANEDPAQAQPSHSTTRVFLGIVLANRSGKLLKLNGKEALHLCTQETWRALKDRLRSRNGVVGMLKAPSKPINLDLAYPEEGRETVRHPHEAMLRACRVAQAQKERASD